MVEITRQVNVNKGAVRHNASCRTNKDKIQSLTWRREAKSRPIPFSLNTTNVTHK